MTFPTWPARARTDRGAVLPSPVVLLTVVAVVLAAVAFFVTRDNGPAERDISASKAAATPSQSSTVEASDTPTEPAEPTKTPKPVNRGDHTVVVFNNTPIKGLAGRVSSRVGKAGWKVGATDNWYGTVSATTVYFPPGKRNKAAAQLLALDLGIARIKPADTDSDMSSTNLTLILTGELD